MKVVVGGGSGLVGQALVESFRADGHEVVVVSRRPRAGAVSAGSVSWDTVGGAIEDADAVVNLAGVSIGGGLRWGADRKEAIVSSRVDTTRRLVQEIGQVADPPRVLVTASGIGFAGDAGEDVVDESHPYGRDFLAGVCEAWEAAAAKAPVRHVAVRTAFVIARGAPSLRLMALPFRLFAGGPIGNGRQWFPWIHLDDLVRVYRRAIDDESLEGPVHAVGPEALRQREAARELGAVLHRPALLPTPAIALRLALGEQADLLLHGQHADSRKLDGFEFRYRGIRAAFEDALP
jgi:hypothetical protein